MFTTISSQQINSKLISVPNAKIDITSCKFVANAKIDTTCKFIIQSNSVLLAAKKEKEKEKREQNILKKIPFLFRCTCFNPLETPDRNQ